MKCDECGFDYESVTAADAPDRIAAFARRYRAPLTRFLPGEDGEAVVRARPGPEVWAAIEYAAHVRDVFSWYDERVRRSQVEDRPDFDGPDPDEAAAAGRYREADPAQVADELADSAARLAATLTAVPSDAWDRVHLRSGEERSVLFTAQRAVHEGGHHLLDIGRALRAARTGGGA